MIKLEEFWESSITPMYDAESKEFIYSETILKHGDAEVIKFEVDGRGYISVEFDKEPEDAENV